jgi:sugar phosphate isomerase/epimerase
VPQEKKEPVERRLSISTAAFDGYDLPTAFHEIAELGVNLVEIAFIQGYMEAFDENYFSDSNARTIQQALTGAGLSSLVFSAHMDLGDGDATTIFRKRMDFAKSVGADIIVTNAAVREKEQTFLRNISELARDAELMDLVIALENPGDGIPNVIDSAHDAADVIPRIGSDAVRLNYDFGNVISHFFERVRPEDDFVDGLGYTAHLHLKDVKRDRDGWVFTEIGKGAIDYRFILETLKAKSRKIPLSLEVPLRIRRRGDASPERAPEPVPLAEIRRVLAGSVACVKAMLATDTPGSQGGTE